MLFFEILRQDKLVPDQKWRVFSISGVRLTLKCKMNETAPKSHFGEIFGFWSKLDFTCIKTAPRELARLRWRYKIWKELNPSFHWKKIVTFYQKLTNLARNEIWSEIRFFPKNRAIFEIFESEAKIDFFSSIFW